MANSSRYELSEGSGSHKLYKYAGWAALVLLIVVVMFAYSDTGSFSLLGNDYKLGLPRLTKGIAFMIAILGLQVVAGYTGQLSLGQGFFFGTGAYIAAWLVADHNWSWFSTLIVVVPACFLLGMAFGIPALRIRGLYLALVTLGLAAVFPSLTLLDIAEPYTGGAAGKQTDSDLLAPDWLPLDGIASWLQKIPFFGQYFGDGDLSSREKQKIWTFLVMVALAAVCFKMVSTLIRSRPGRAIRAIRDNETSAAITGVNLSLYKTLSFGVASALAGVGGMVYVAELGIASNNDFTQLISIFFVVGMVVGGVGTLPGAVIGGLVIALIPQWASDTQELPLVPERWLQGPTGPLFMGILLIVLTFVLPGGIMSGVRRIRGRIVLVRPARPEISATARTEAAGVGSATVSAEGAESEALA
jgi:branched-chain amino acid transport system permease protein